MLNGYRYSGDTDVNSQVDDADLTALTDLSAECFVIF